MTRTGTPRSKEAPEGRRPTPAAALAMLLVRGYQVLISPLLGRNCRFCPTCSQYALIALMDWGLFRGGWLTLRRLLRCGPWSEGGYDPPPRRPRGEGGGAGADDNFCD